MKGKPATGKGAPPKKEQKKKEFSLDDYVKPGISREDVAECKKAFDAIDQDRSGIIDPKELRQAFEELNLTVGNQVIYQILGALDQDHSGGLDFGEFVKISTAKISEKNTFNEIKRVFDMYDSSEKGHIDLVDLKRVSRELGEEMTEEELTAMFRKADKDDNLMISPETFYWIVTGHEYGA